MDELVKSNDPIPQGATIGGDNTSLVKSNEAIPQGASVGQPQQPQQSTTSDVPWYKKITNFQEDMAKGFGKGAEATASGVSTLLNKIPGVGETLAPSAGVAAMKEQAQPTNFAQNVGYGGETLMEFLLGDEALSAVGSLGMKLDKIAKIVKTVEQSPKLMAALKIGTSALKAGTVQGGITLARKQNVEEALKEGGTMAAVSAALGVPLEVLQKALKTASEGGEALTKLEGKAANAPTDSEIVGSLRNKVEEGNQRLVAEHEMGQAGEAEKALSQGIENAPEKKELVTGLQGQINDAETAMHSNFEEGLKDVHERLQGAELPQKGGPIANKAQELLDNPPINTEGENEVLTATRGAARDMLKPQVADMLELAAKGERETEAATKPLLVDASGNPIGGSAAKTEPLKPWTIEDLTAFRTKVRQLAQSFPRGDINARTLRQLIPSIDDTIEEMATKTGDETLTSDYKALRDTYKNTVKFFDKPEYKIIQKLQDGDMDEANRMFLKSGNSISNLDKLEEFFKQTQGKQAGEAMNEFTDNLVSTMMKDAADKDTGVVDAEKFLKDFGKLKDPVKERLGKLSGGQLNARVQEALENAKTVAGTKEALEASTKNRIQIFGNMDAPKTFITGKNAMERIDTMRDLIGEQNMQEFGNNVFDSYLRDAKNKVTGKFDPAKFLTDIDNIDKDVQQSLFKVGNNTHVDELLKDAKSAKSAQILARAGILGAFGGVTGGLSHFGAGLATILGMTLGSGAGTIETARGILDYVADHPATWKMFKLGNKVASGSVGKATSAAVRLGVTNELQKNPNDVKSKAKRVMVGTKGPLGGE